MTIELKAYQKRMVSDLSEIIRRNLWNKSFEAKKVRDHNRELHATSAELAYHARRLERMMERARWS